MQRRRSDEQRGQDQAVETADLNNRELLVPRLIAGNQHVTNPDPRNVGFSEETSEIYRNSYR